MVAVSPPRSAPVLAWPACPRLGFLVKFQCWSTSLPPHPSFAWRTVCPWCPACSSASKSSPGGRGWGHRRNGRARRRSASLAQPLCGAARRDTAHAAHCKRDRNATAAQLDAWRDRLTAHGPTHARRTRPADKPPRAHPRRTTRAALQPTHRARLPRLDPTVRRIPRTSSPERSSGARSPGIPW